MVRKQSACRLGPSQHATAFQLLQFCSVKSWPAGFRSLVTRRNDVHRQDRPDEAVVSPTLCPQHRSGDSDVTDVSAAADGIVNQMPVSIWGASMLSCIVLI